MIDGELRLRVRDTGVGMTKDEIAFAMQPFHQLDTAPRKQMGTGLGPARHQGAGRCQSRAAGADQRAAASAPRPM